MVKNFLFGSLPASNSPAGTFNFLDFRKWLRHLVVVIAAAIVTIVFDEVAKYTVGLDLGQYQFVVSFIISSGGLEYVRRYVSNHLPRE